MKKLLLMFLCTLLFGVNLNAGITATIGTVTATSGSTVSIPVTVTGANGTSGAFAVSDLYFNYDPAAVSTTGGSFSDYSTLAPSADWVGNVNYSTGKIMNGYVSASLSNVSFPDGTILFKINVTYTGTAPTVISWDAVNSYFADENINNINVTWVNGGINPPAANPAVPTLSLPANLATSIATTPTLTWNTAANATSYKVQLSTSSTFASTLVDQTVTTTNFNITTPLSNSTQYFWRVKGINGALESNWSDVWSFTTAAPVSNGITATIGTVTAASGSTVSIPITISGANGSNAFAVSDLYINYDPAKVSTTGGSFSDYSTQAPSADWVGNVNYSSGKIMNGYVSASLSNVSFPDGTILFKINITYTGTTPTVLSWDNINSYFADENINNINVTWVNGAINPITTGPAVPTLSLPANLATNVSVNPNLVWNTAAGATSYTLEVSTSNTFATTVVNQTTTSTNYAVTGLANNQMYYWRVKSSDGTNFSAWSDVWSFTTEAPATLAAPVLATPANNAVNIGLAPTLTWNSVATATGYHLEVSVESTFATKIFDNAVVGTSQALTGLANNTQYFWRVKAVNQTTSSAWSTVWNFTTEQIALVAPVLATPANNATNVSNTPSLTWNSVATATGYYLEVSTSSTFATTVYANAVVGTSQTLPALQYLTQYYWRVKAVRGAENGPWSATWNFTTQEEPLLPPTLATPTNGAGNVALNPTLTWNAASNVNYYTLQVATSNNFTAPFIFNGPVNALSQAISGLTNGTQYFWRVKSHRGANESAWSTVFSFNTVSVIPPPNQASYLSFSNVTTSSMTLSWLNGNGTGRLVLAATENLTAGEWTSIINALNVDVTAYNAANGAWANKIAVTAGGKTAYVIGKTVGTARILNVTGLGGSTNYYFHVVEHKYTPAIYNPMAATLNPRMKTTLQGVTVPVAIAANMVSTDMFFANWTLASPNVDFFELELNGVIYDVGVAATANGFHFPFVASPNTTYTYRVRTVFNHTRSDWSNTRTVTTYPENVLTGPENGCVDFPNVFTVNLTGVELEWTAQNADEEYDWANSFTVSWMLPGTYDVSVDITDALGNEGSAQASITINAAPVVTCPTSFSVCANGTPVNLNTLQGLNPQGGIFIGDGVNQNGFFNPADAGVGVHTIAYAYQDATTGCDNVCEFTITVNAIPTVTAPANMSVCVSAAPITLTGGLPVGGTYTMGTTAITTFNPATAGVGVHNITYSFTNASGCTASATFTITVNALPTITVPNNMTVCNVTPAFPLTGATPVGGTYTGTGVSNNMFNAATAGIGVHTITYTVTNANNCTNSATYTIEVTAAPTVTVPANSSVCVDAIAFTLTGALPAGGVYSIGGVPTTMFNPGVRGVGVHTITYTYTAGTCVVSNSYTITVKPLPVITVPTIAPMCVNANPLTLAGATPVGGTYSGTGVTNGVFNPATAGVGVHTITYTATNDGCANSATFNITVNALSTITSHPQSASVLVGANASFSVVATNASSYQWEVSVNNGPWTAINGETNATLNLSAVALNLNGNRYRVVVMGCGNNLTSNAATLTVVPPLVTPATQATNITWLNWGRNDISFAWTNGSGANRIVAAVEGTTTFPAWTPTDNVAYTANPNFAAASVVTGSPNVKIVYSGTGNATNVSGLLRNTSYAFHVFEFNQQGASILYRTNSATGNPNGRATARKEGQFDNDTKHLDAPFALGTVSPNPASENIYFNIEVYESANFRLELVNVLGEVVYADRMNLSEGTYPMSIAVANQSGRLSSGTYILRLTSNGIAITRNVVVIQ